MSSPKQPKDVLPPMSDEFFFGQAPTLDELRVRTEEEAEGDPTINWSLVDEIRQLDDKA